MKRTNSHWRRIVLSISVAVAGGIAGFANELQAAEEASAFLAELRARGYYDTANEYLDSISKTDLVDDDFKKAVDYEQALNLVSEARTISDIRVRDAKLMEAINKFKKFAKERPTNSRVNSVRMQIGNVYIALAEAKLKDADKPAADRTSLLGDARQLFNAALEELTEAEKLIQAARKPLEGKDKDGKDKIPKNREDLRELRTQLRNDWIVAELAQALVIYKLASTYEAGSENYKTQLAKAAKGYGELYEKHRTRGAGLYARVQEGRCYVDMAQYENAHNCFADLWVDEYDKHPRARGLKLEALRYAMKAWIGQKNYDDALLKMEIELKPGEDITETGLDIILQEAIAQKLKADTIRDKIQKKAKDNLLARAEKGAKAVIAKAKPYPKIQKEARKLLENLGATIAEKTPRTFDEAYDLAVAAMQKRSLAKASLKTADAERKPGLEKRVQEEANKAFRYFRMAVSFAGEDPDIRKLKSSQKALCYLFYDRGDQIHAAVIGNYIAKQYPGDGKTAKFGSWIAMNAFLTEYGTAWNGNDFEVEQIQRYAKRIADSWPDSTEAVEANYRLVVFAIMQGDVDGALGYLNGIPEDSPRRGKAELTTGQSLWNKYATSLYLADDDENKLPKDKLARILAEAEKVLVAGIKRMEATGKVESNLVAAAYSLAQLYAGSDRYLEAISHFENPDYGALTLVHKDDPIAKDGNYGEKTRRLALRSYISSLPKVTDAAKRQKLLDNAMKMVDELEKAIGENDQGGERLTQMFIELGADLKKQRLFLEQKGDKAGIQAMTKAFETFLGLISKKGNSYANLIWTAETYFELGKSNDAGEGQATKVAAKYYRNAAQTYKKILDTETSKPGFLKNPRQRTTIEMRLAECYRRQGEYENALQLLAGILKRKQANLTVQTKAAETLYHWGSKDREQYVKSILGGEKDEDTGKKIVWGWRRISDATQKNPAFQKHFFQANYYLVNCRYKLALSYKKDDPEKYKKLLSAAEQTLLSLHRRYPAFGCTDGKVLKFDDKDVRQQFDELYRLIQQKLGKEPTGLNRLAAN
ncbi:MAG: hypothetical protein VB835_11950 [Pirellulales bacterium]